MSTPKRKSLAISGKAKERFEELEALMWRRSRHRPTHSDVINYLFENQKDQVDAVHMEINYLEQKIRDGCAPKVHEQAMKTLAQLRRIISGTEEGKK